MKINWSKKNLVLAFWVLFFIIDLLKKAGSLSGASERILTYYFPGLLFWILLTFPLIRFFEWSGKIIFWKRVLSLILSGIVIGTVKVILTSTVLFYGISFTSDEPIHYGVLSFLSRISLFYFIEAFITIWVVLIILFMAELHEKYKKQTILTAELDKQLANAQLQTLKMQLQPHFLFNANNVISMLIRQGENEKAIEMISGLSDLLRKSLEREDQQLISLNEELELLKKYLEIELIRFEDRLKIDFEIEEGVQKAMIPNFILQPLLENAFKHGVSKSIGKALIKISAKREDTMLILQIFNSGPSLQDFHFNDSKQKGIGISNTIMRLKQLYPGNYTFNMYNRNNGVIVEMKIPFSSKHQ